METQSPSDGDSRRKRRRYSSGSVVRRLSEGASSTGELGSMRRGLAQGSSSFVGSGSGIHFVRTVQAAFARNYSRQGSEAIDEDIVPGEDDRLPHTRHPAGSLWTSGEVEFLPSNQPGTPFSFDDLVYWSQPYFDNWHPPFPFLIGSRVLELFEEASTHGMQSLNVVNAIAVRSVLSMSLADRRQMPREDGKLIPSNLIFVTIDDAVACLTPVMMQPSTLAGLQALVAIQSFLVSMLHLNAASRIGGVIVRIAFHLGLHRCPSRYEQFSLADADIRRRLFWTIYSFERYLSQSLGLPLDLKDDDIDVCYPDNELHQRQGQEATPWAIRSPDPRVLLLPAFLGRHGTIRGLILELRHISVKHRTTDPDDVANIEAEISKWWNEAQDLLEPHFMDDENISATASSQNGLLLLKASHKLLLVVQKQESTILLNRPVITSGQNTPLFASAMQKCIGASKQIVSKVYQHLYDGMIEVGSRDGRIRSPLFWPGFTWCVWMSGLILLYAASEGHYSIRIAQREADRCIKILETLALRGNFWPGACAQALKDLQKALAHKSTQAGSSLRRPDEPHLNRTSQKNPSSTQNQASNPVNGEKYREHRHVADSSVSPPVAPFGFVPYERTGHTQNNQSVNPNSVLSEFDATSQQIPAQAAPNIAAFDQPNIDFNYGDWQGIGVNFDHIPANGDGTCDRFNDIFQLMDVSYQLSEQQMLEPANVPRY